MPFPVLTAASVGAKLKGFFSSKWFWAVLLLVAVAGGTYWYLAADKKADVAAAVTTDRKDQTIASHEIKDKTSTASAKIDEQFDRRARQTAQEFSNVRNEIRNAPAQDRDAPGSPLVIDTLNRLERLRTEGEAESGVPDPNIPKG